MNIDIAELRLYQLISPSLPNGAFTYSQAIEWAVESHWIHDSNSLSNWLQSLLNDNLHWLELPLIIRLYSACKTNEETAFSKWSQHLYASRETKELRSEEQNRARALLVILQKLPDSKSWPQLSLFQKALLKSEAAGFALAAYHWKIELEKILAGYTWCWLENAIAAAIKLIPLGQSDGQALLYNLAERIPKLVEESMLVQDDDIGSSSLSLAIASSLHETQYTRLFRS